MRTIRNLFIVMMGVSLLMSCGMTMNKANNSIEKKLAKAKYENFEKKIKELEKNGWKVDDSSRTLELALLEHYKNRNDNKDLYEIEADVSMCRSVNVCRANAANNAFREYADLAGSVVKGKAVTDMRNNASSITPEEFDNFYAAYVRNVEASAKGVLKKSYSLVKDNGNGKSYKIVYLVDEQNASEARKKAMQRALEETKLSIEHGLWIEKFVNENPLKDE